MFRQGTNSVFKRLFLLFLCVVMIVYVVLTGLFVRYVAKQQEVEIAGQKARVSNAAASIEQQIQAVINLEYQLFGETDIARIAQQVYADEYERSQLILELLSTIQTTQSLNHIIDDIILTFPYQQFQISARNGYDRKKCVPEMYTETWIGFYPENGRLVKRLRYPVFHTADEDYMPDYEICIAISTEYLEKFIEPFHNQKFAGAFWAVPLENNTSLLQPNTQKQPYLDCWRMEWNSAHCPESFETKAYCNHRNNIFVSRTILDKELSLVTYQDSRELGWKKSGILISMAVILILTGGMFGLLVMWANRRVSKPIYRIMDAFGQLQAGELDVEISHEMNDEFGYIYDSFNSTVSKIKELISNIREQERLLQKAEQIQLQSQINPHFLYNSFYNIKFMAHNEDYEQIEVFVTALAKYFRFLNKETEQTVSLATEASHMQNYIEIQQMRFGDKITVEVEQVPQNVKDFLVPKLILQPIIENAYNYGLKNKLSDCFLSIRYRLEVQWLYIDIEDNGGSVDEQTLERLRCQIHTYDGEAVNHALTNIQRRLMLAYGENCGVFLNRGSAGGLKVTLKLDRTIRL